MPPCASGPVFTVSRPRRNGSVCATAGAGKRVTAAAAPATLPAKIVRRLTLRDLILPGMRILPFPRLVAPADARAGNLLAATDGHVYDGPIGLLRAPQSDLSLAR